MEQAVGLGGNHPLDQPWNKPLNKPLNLSYIRQRLYVKVNGGTIQNSRSREPVDMKVNGEWTSKSMVSNVRTNVLSYIHQRHDVTVNGGPIQIYRSRGLGDVNVNGQMTPMSMGFCQRPDHQSMYFDMVNRFISLRQ